MEGSSKTKNKTIYKIIINNQISLDNGTNFHLFMNYLSNNNLKCE